MAGAGSRPWWQLACSAFLQMCSIQELLHPCSFHLGFKDKPGKPGHIVPQRLKKKKKDILAPIRLSRLDPQL